MWRSPWTIVSGRTLCACRPPAKKTVRRLKMTQNGDVPSSLPPGWVPVPDPLRRHQFDGHPYNSYRQDVYNFSLGVPSPKFLVKCKDIIEKATKHRMEEDKNEGFVFQYGPAAGPNVYRQALSGFLSRRFGDKVQPENLFLTCGSTNGLMVITSQLLSARPVIFVEEATFMIALDTFRQIPEAKIVSVPMDTRKGIDVKALEALAEEEWKTWNKNPANKLTESRPYWSMLYTITVYQNPTGSVLAREPAEALVNVTKRLGILAVNDDVYNMLHYKDTPLPERLYAVGRDIANGLAQCPVETKPLDPPLPEVAADAMAKGHVISNGTFSKIFSPASRLGWIEAPGAIILNILSRGFVMGGGALNNYMAYIMASALELGLVDKHIDEMNKDLGPRMTTLCDILDEYLPPETGCQLDRPDGGYFVWLQLPQGVSAAEALQYTEKTEKVAAIAGDTFNPNNGVDPNARFKNCMRISISFHDQDLIREGATGLGRGLRNYLQSLKK